MSHFSSEALKALCALKTPPPSLWMLFRNPAGQTRPNRSSPFSPILLKAKLCEQTKGFLPRLPPSARYHWHTAAKKSYAENDQIRQLLPRILNTLCSKLLGDVFLYAHDLALFEGDSDKQITAVTLNYIYISSIKMSIITSEVNYETEVLAVGQHERLFFS